jgi:hypothetical protein
MTPMTSALQNEHGSVMVEQTLSTGVLVALVAALLFLGSLGASKVWLRYVGNEAAVCLASDSTQAECEQSYRDRTAILERIGHMRSFQLSVSPRLASVQWHFEFTGYNQVLVTLDGHVNLQLPLQKQTGFT